MTVWGADFVEFYTTCWLRPLAAKSAKGPRKATCGRPRASWIPVSQTEKEVSARAASFPPGSEGTQAPPLVAKQSPECEGMFWKCRRERWIECLVLKVYNF